jgi:hypothetical protein
MTFNLFSVANPKLMIRVVLGLGVLVFYDVLFNLLIALPHTVLILLHFLYEACEQLLDWLIEHLFHTSPRTTEIIVFYMMALVIGWMGVKFTMALPDCYCRIYKSLSNYWQHKKNNIIKEWGNWSIIEKFKWGSVFMTSTLVMVVLVIS